MFKEILDHDGTKQGSTRFNNINIVDDYPPGDHINLDQHCSGFWLAWTIPPFIRPNTHRPSEIILCRHFFNYGTIEGGPNREWPGTTPATYDDIGNRVSGRMETLGHHLLHEYTHVTEIVDPVLRVRTEDHAYDFLESRNLDKALATNNADSYACFATELMWTAMCCRDFEPPLFRR